MGTDSQNQTPLRHRLRLVEAARSRARKSLKLWRTIYWTIGLLAVVAAAISGFGGLTDLIGKAIVGGLALFSAIVASVDKFLSASDKIAALQLRHKYLDQIVYQLEAYVADFDYRQQDGRSEEITAWLDDKCSAADKEMKQVNDETAEV